MNSGSVRVWSLFTLVVACGDPGAPMGPSWSPPGSPQASAPVDSTMVGAAGAPTTATPAARVPVQASPAAAGAPAPVGPSGTTPSANGAAGGANGGVPPVAATSGNGPPAPAGPAGIAVDPATNELVFRTEPLDIEPGAESYTCYGSTLDRDMVVDGFTKSAQQFVHHAQFMKALLPEPEGTSVCNEQFKLTWMPIFLAGAGASELRLDEGVGHVLPAGTQLVLQMHLFNASDEVQTQPVEIRMHQSVSPNPIPVAPWAIGSSEIRLAPHQPGQAKNVCTMNGSVELVAVFPHMHQTGRRFTVEVGKSLDAMQPFYSRDPFDFDDQRMEKRKLTLEAGDLLRVTCDYMNTTDTEVTFGESSNQEMCFFVGFALGDAPVQADCPNLWDALFAL